jgi:hypothetical protein
MQCEGHTTLFADEAHYRAARGSGGDQFDKMTQFASSLLPLTIRCSAADEPDFLNDLYYASLISLKNHGSDLHLTSMK